MDNITVVVTRVLNSSEPRREKEVDPRPGQAANDAAASRSVPQLTSTGRPSILTGVCETSIRRSASSSAVDGSGLLRWRPRCRLGPGSRRSRAADPLGREPVPQLRPGARAPRRPSSCATRPTIPALRLALTDELGKAFGRALRRAGLADAVRRRRSAADLRRSPGSRRRPAVGRTVARAAPARGRPDDPDRRRRAHRRADRARGRPPLRSRGDLGLRRARRGIPDHGGGGDPLRRRRTRRRTAEATRAIAAAAPTVRPRRPRPHAGPRAPRGVRRGRGRQERAPPGLGAGERARRGSAVEPRRACTRRRRARRRIRSCCGPRRGSTRPSRRRPVRRASASSISRPERSTPRLPRPGRFGTASYVPARERRALPVLPGRRAPAAAPRSFGTATPTFRPTSSFSSPASDHAIALSGVARVDWIVAGRPRRAGPPAPVFFEPVAGYPFDGLVARASAGPGRLAGLVDDGLARGPGRLGDLPRGGPVRRPDRARRAPDRPGVGEGRRSRSGTCTSIRRLGPGPSTATRSGP